jgi:uncharacterized protein (TIGR03437 family)
MRFTAFISFFILFTQFAFAQTYIASTIAGSNPIGDGGPARAARLNGLQGLSADGRGNIYLSDLSSRRIRVINREGVINTLAGGGTGNIAEGVAATSVRLQSPFGLAYNTRTNELYFSDDVLGLVLAVDIAKGTLRTLAGSPGKLDGGDGGPATNAGLFGPKGLSLDTDQNNLYIADSLNSLVRKVDLRTGIITTVAGILDSFGFLGDGGPATRATLSGPEHVAWSPDGYLYIADTFNYRIRRIAPNGNIGTYSGNGSFFNIAPNFSDFVIFLPQGLTVDSGGRILATMDSRVVVLNPDQTFRSYAGTFDPGFNGETLSATAALLDNPTGLASDGNAVLIADAGNGRVRRVDNNLISLVGGGPRYRGDSGPALEAWLTSPTGVYKDKNGFVLIADRDNHCVRRISPNGMISIFAGRCGLAGNLPLIGPANVTQLTNPTGVTMDADGNVYIASYGRVSRVDTQNNLIHLYRNQTLSGSLYPYDLAVDSVGKRLFFSDPENDAVYTISLNFTGNTAPAPVRFAGGGRTGFAGDTGQASVAQLFSPRGLAYSAAGELFIADSDNRRIRRVDRSGVITTVIGTGRVATAVPGGPARLTPIDEPFGLALDAQNNLWFSTRTRIWRQSGDQVESIAGGPYNQPDFAGDGGPGPDVRMESARGLVVDGDGNVIFADRNNQRIRQLTPRRALVAARIESSRGNGQSGPVGSALPQALVVRAVTSTGELVSGVVVSFAVTQGNGTLNVASVTTGVDGLAGVTLTLGATAGVVRVTATAAGLTPVVFEVNATAVAPSTPRPAIAVGGIIGVGASVPQVRALATRGIVSIFGENFLPAGSTGRRVDFATELVGGALPTRLLGVCVEMGGVRAPMLDVFPNQLNVVVPLIPAGAITGGSAAVRVISNCEQSSAQTSLAEIVPVAAAAPEFLYFQVNGDGRNPVAAVNAVTGALVGPPGPLGLAPAKPGDILTIYATSLGATGETIAPGGFAAGASAVSGEVSIRLGGEALDAADVLYVGVSPGSLIYQVNLRVPRGRGFGNLPLEITVGGIRSPANAYLTVIEDGN